MKIIRDFIQFTIDVLKDESGQIEAGILGLAEVIRSAGAPRREEIRRLEEEQAAETALAQTIAKSQAEAKTRAGIVEQFGEGLTPEQKAQFAVSGTVTATRPAPTFGFPPGVPPGVPPGQKPAGVTVSPRGITQRFVPKRTPQERVEGILAKVSEAGVKDVGAARAFSSLGTTEFTQRFQDIFTRADQQNINIFDIQLQPIIDQAKIKDISFRPLFGEGVEERSEAIREAFDKVEDQIFGGVRVPEEERIPEAEQIGGIETPTETPITETPITTGVQLTQEEVRQGITSVGEKEILEAILRGEIVIKRGR